MYFQLLFILLEIVLLKHSFAESCGSNYSVRNIPADVISLYERNGGFKKEAGCPLIKTNDEFPLKYHEYLFGKEVSNGACISSTYQKGSVPYGGGPFGDNEKMVGEVEKRGGAFFAQGQAFFLPYATIYTTINHKNIREIDDKKQTVTLDISLTMM
jgi:hypothetical protein